MGLRKLNSIFLTGALILCAVSCKDDDESTTYPSLSGYLNFDVPTFVKPNTKITMTPRGLNHPDGEELGYYWKVTPTMTKSDTTRFENGLDRYGNPSDGSFTHTFSDTLKTYTVYAYAFADGYSTSSASKYCTVVSGGLNESITGIGIFGDTPYETIDGKRYYYTPINGTDWMRFNLDNPSAGAPYLNCTAMSDVFGRYYSYEEALTACPEGWTLPTEEDWIALAKAAGAPEDTEKYSNIPGIAASLMVNAYFNDTRLWEYWPEVGDITDATGISMIPTGFAMLGKKDLNVDQTDPNKEHTYPNAIFKGYKEYAAFWTADKVDGEDGMAYYRYLINKQPDLMINKGDTKSFGASVRCVRKK